jgi:hypothetical protein
VGDGVIVKLPVSLYEILDVGVCVSVADGEEESVAVDVIVALLLIDMLRLAVCVSVAEMEPVILPVTLLVTVIVELGVHVSVEVPDWDAVIVRETVRLPVALMVRVTLTVLLADTVTVVVLVRDSVLVGDRVAEAEGLVEGDGERDREPLILPVHDRVTVDVILEVQLPVILRVPDHDTELDIEGEVEEVTLHAIQLPAFKLYPYAQALQTVAAALQSEQWGKLVLQG